MSTLYLARLNDPKQAGPVVDQIDALFANSATPTKTTPERFFVSSAIAGVVGMIEFSRSLGYVAVGILFVGVANNLSMTVRALEILKKRYAKGEVTKEEFDRIKTDIADD
jgi:hypothetical protein